MAAKVEPANGRLTFGEIGRVAHGRLRPAAIAVRGDRLSGLVSCSALALALLGGVIAEPVHAQSTTGAAGAAASDSTSAVGSNDIIVTAQKRSETVQQTPLSISAYSGAELTSRGINTIEQVGAITPGVSERSSGPGQTEFEMRGIASSGGQSPTVGFYLDEIPLTPPADAQLGKVVIDPDLYDLNRVEILRGPQGTLYGAGSMGGTIKVITNQPDLSRFYGSVDATLSGTQGGGTNYGGDVMLNVPLVSDRVALRVIGTDKYVDGWIDRIILSPFPLETNGGDTRGDVTAAPIEKVYPNVNNERLRGVRSSLLVKLGDNFTLTPGVFYQKINQNGLSYADVPPGVGSEAHYQPYDVAEPYSDQFTLYSLTAKYSLPAFDITSATGYYLRTTSMDEDSTEATRNFLDTVIGIPDVSFADVGPFVTYATDHSRQFTEELRLTSNGPGRFQWLLGGFYQNFRSTDAVFTNTPGPIVEQIFGVPSLFDINAVTDFKQYAIFGEASYRIAQHLKFTAGLRYFSYKTHEQLAESGGLPNGSLIPSLFNLPSSDHGFNPKFNLSYTPTRDLTLYAQAARGFRPGSGNNPPPTGCPQDQPLQYNPDSLWSYELGEKAQLFGSRLTINGDVYYEDWSGIQQSVSQPCGSSYTANAGTAHVYGSEIEITAKIARHVTLSNSTGYTHARIVKGVAGGTFYAGERVQDVPAWTNATTLSFDQPLDDKSRLIASIVNAYVGSMTDVSYDINRVPSHDFQNMRTGIERNGLKLELFVDNVTNKRVIIGNTNALSFNVATFNRVSTNQPRTFGIRLSYQFGDY